MHIIPSLPLPLGLITLALSSLPPLLAQQMTLSLNSILPVTLTSASASPLSLALPSTTGTLSVSVSLCTAAQPWPKFFVSNDSDAGGRGGGGTAQLALDGGVGVWSGGTSAGGRVVVYLGEGAAGVPGGAWSFELAVSTGSPLHRSMTMLPLLGDTTATQALLFSPPFAPPSLVPPTYPNYTLPGADLSPPAPPPQAMQPNASLILAPMAQVQQQGGLALDKSACAVRNAVGSVNGTWTGKNGTGGVNASTELVLRDVDGWRWQWLVEGLTANTNYTAWVVQDGGALAGPIYAFTKSPAFQCPLVHSLPFCPLTAYAVPLPPTPDGATSYTNSNLPTNTSGPLIDSLNNFTISLLTFACGRDVYSPRQTCETCATAYRNWACAVSFPRCGEAPPALNVQAPALAPPTRTMQGAAPAYSELLPCIETCQEVDRACPPMLQWACPDVAVNANWSYGVGFVDGWDGDQGRGVPGVAQDQWGMSWCNG